MVLVMIRFLLRMVLSLSTCLELRSHRRCTSKPVFGSVPDRFTWRCQVFPEFGWHHPMVPDCGRMRKQEQQQRSSGPEFWKEIFCNFLVICSNFIFSDMERVLCGKNRVLALRRKTGSLLSTPRSVISFNLADFLQLHFPYLLKKRGMMYMGLSWVARA